MPRLKRFLLLALLLSSSAWPRPAAVRNQHEGVAALRRRTVPGLSLPGGPMVSDVAFWQTLPTTCAIATGTSGIVLIERPELVACVELGYAKFHSLNQGRTSA